MQTDLLPVSPVQGQAAHAREPIHSYISPNLALVVTWAWLGPDELPTGMWGLSNYVLLLYHIHSQISNIDFKYNPYTEYIVYGI